MPHYVELIILVAVGLLVIALTSTGRSKTLPASVVLRNSRR